MALVRIQLALGALLKLLIQVDQPCLKQVAAVGEQVARRTMKIAQFPHETRHTSKIHNYMVHSDIWRTVKGNTALTKLRYFE